MPMDYLYLIREGFNFAVKSDRSLQESKTYVKVGIAGNPIERLKQLQTSNPRPLQIERVRPIKSTEDKFKYESEIHSLFQNYRVSGEWFLAHDDIFHWFSENSIYGNIDEVLKMSAEDYFLTLGQQRQNSACEDNFRFVNEQLLRELIAHLGGEWPYKQYHDRYTTQSEIDRIQSLVDSLDLDDKQPDSPAQCVIRKRRKTNFMEKEAA